MSKQINFYLLDSDLHLIDNFVQKLDLKILSVPFLTEKIKISDSLLAENEAKKKYFTRYLVLSNQIDQIKLRKIETQNYFLIQDLTAPVLEYSQSVCNLSENTLRRGRFYLETGYWNENKEWIEKNPEFLQAAKKLFAWFKKNFQKIDDQVFYGNYTSQNVQKWVENGGKIVLN